MTAPHSKRPAEDVLARFATYHRQHPAWGSLHIVLDDENIDDESVQWCQRYATQEGDSEGAELAAILLTLSKSQTPEKMALSADFSRRHSAYDKTTKPNDGHTGCARIRGETPSRPACVHCPKSCL